MGAAYQTFIDSLANQSKTTYSAFLQLYSPLSEAPDPYPLLEASVDSLVVAEEVVPKIRTENEQLRKQVSRLTTQVEDVEKRLESETRTRKTVESSRDERISEVEKSWAAVLQEKDDNWQAREQASEEKVANQERLLKELKANLEVSQRLSRAEEGVGGEADGHDGIGRSATTAELELVHSELDRANTRLAAVEARNEQLRTDLARTASTVTSIVAVEDDPAFLQLRTQNSSLLRKLEAAKMDKQAEIGSLQSGLRALERELASLRQDSRLYKEKLEKRGDYEEIKKELEILRVGIYLYSLSLIDGC